MTDKNLLAPLHALIDPAYPENLTLVAEYLFMQLVEDEADAAGTGRAAQLDRLALLALRLAERLSAELGGMNFYFNKGLRYRASLRDREMFGRFNGRNFDELARSYNLTPMRVRQIIAAMMAEEIARRQGKLDLN